MDTSPAPASPSQTEVRALIRDLLTTSDKFHAAPPETRREIANGLVRICSTALHLAGDANVTSTTKRVPSVGLARAQSAGSEFSGVAADRVASTTKNILTAVSFPRFVTELLTGVFRALVDTNQQQMHAYVELIRNVSASMDGFADANVGVQGAREWLVERFPGSFEIQGEVDEFDEPGLPLSREEQAERDAQTRLQLRSGAAMPSAAALRTALGLAGDESIPGDPESLVPIARSALARNRQQMLASMVMLGLQRIVVESGRLHASMRFHIDTHSAATDDRGSTFDLRNEASADVGAKFGPWGVEAKMKNTIGYVSTSSTQTTEEMNTDLDLNSSVELVFKTDYLPLDRLAGQGQVDRIRVNTLNPDTEARVAADERRGRREAQGKQEEGRRSQLSDRLKAPPPPPPPPPKPAPQAPQAAQPTAALPLPGQRPAAQPPAGQQPGSQQTGGPQTGGAQQPAGQQTARQPPPLPTAQLPETGKSSGATPSR